MKQHDLPPPGAPSKRRRFGRAQDDHVIDTYKLRKKLPEPTRCPDCGAIYREGRWQWTSIPPALAHEERCTACHRIKDNYPAGVVTIEGSFVDGHRADILGLARNLEATEKSEHPMNRILAIETPRDDTLIIKTTDIHLPRRIGEAMRRAFHGELRTHYDEENYFVRVEWRRDA